MCFGKRLNGKAASDEEIVARFPELMPELGKALRKLHIVADAAEAFDEDRWLKALERMDADPALDDTSSVLVDGSLIPPSLPHRLSPRRAARGQLESTASWVDR